MNVDLTSFDSEINLVSLAGRQACLGLLTVLTLIGMIFLEKNSEKAEILFNKTRCDLI
jgi:hypothetical protein